MFWEMSPLRVGFESLLDYNVFSRVTWRFGSLPEELHTEATNMFEAQFDAVHGVVDV